MTIQELLQKLTLQEKAVLLQGSTTWTTHAVPRLQIPSIFLSDGPHGLRKQVGSLDHLGLHESIPATCFPTAATMANSWDTGLGEELGAALGEEAAANDIHVLLGPGLNIKRSPLCGRNFEYFSEDPYLAGKMAAAYIRGIQSRGVAACPKHFAANSQELRRMAMDSQVDERTLREIYLTGFEIAVREGDPKAIMSSYNLVNGTYANENSHLLRDILREEWNFSGFVVTDWGADNDHTEGVRSGSALVMPNPGLEAACNLVDAVKEGRISEDVLDDRLTELLCIVFATNRTVSEAPKTCDMEAHHALAKKCAGESIVLLENDGILPLHKGTRVGIIGEFARAPRYQGAGSSKVNPTKVDDLVSNLTDRGLYLTGYAQGYSTAPGNDPVELLDDAVALALSADVVVLCLGLDDASECEGLDRTHLRLPQKQLTLLNAVHRVNPNIVLVLSGGAPFLLPGSDMFRAAIHGYLSGQAGAGAMADALLGVITPSGKLSETWPRSLEDTPCHRYFPGTNRIAEYREGLYVGYRYYDTAGVAVRYPFGHGLSYTKFEYTGLKADSRGVTFTVTNTGHYDGSEVAQVYIACRGGKVFRPRKELKGFCKVFLKVGESKTVTVPLDDKAFRYYNVKTRNWEVESGNYDVLVAASAADIRLTTPLRIFGNDAKLPYGELPSYESGQISNVSDEEFSALLGRPLADDSFGGIVDAGTAISQLLYCKSFFMRTVLKIVKKKVDKAEKAGKAGTDLMFAYHMPLRSLSNMTAGKITHQMVEDVVFLSNGHFFRGLGRFIRDYFRGQKRQKAFAKELAQQPEHAK